MWTFEKLKQKDTIKDMKNVIVNNPPDYNRGDDADDEGDDDRKLS